MRARENLRLLRDPNFGPFFFGNLVANSGTWFLTLAAGIFVYRRTDSPFLLGVVGFSQFAGVLLLVPWTGTAADRFDRRRLLLVTQGAASAIAAALTVVVMTGAATSATVIAFVLAIGLVQAFTWPALQAIQGHQVRQDRLGSAIALKSLTHNLARGLGPATATLVIATAGIEWAFFVNALAYLALLVGLLVIHPTPSVAPTLKAPRRTPASESERSHTLTAALTVAGRPGRLRRQLIGRVSVLICAMVAFALAPTLELGLVALAFAGFGFLAASTSTIRELQLSIEPAHRGRIMALWTAAFIGARPLAALVDGAIAGAASPRMSALVMVLPAVGLVGALVVRDRREAGREHPAEAMLDAEPAAPRLTAEW